MSNSQSQKVDLQAMARQVMIEHGFEPDFSAAAQRQVQTIQAHNPAVTAAKNVRDLRGLLWSSIDNDTSRDLDQIEFAERTTDGFKVMVGIADVDAFVSKGSPIDDHAMKQTTSVYTGVRTFPMLPEQLSNDASSLLENQDRPAMVIEFVVADDGTLSGGSVYPALVRNKAQLTYNAVGAWLEEKSGPPPKVAANSDLQQQLKLQNDVAQCLKQQRVEHGALNLDSNEIQPVMVDDQIVDVAKKERNYATDLIEDFMIAANGVVARLLLKVSSLRRIVRTPKRWDRIVQLAATRGVTLPADPDSKALNEFLLKRKAADPDHFADLSLAVIKLIGAGEYVLERPGDPELGHFGLAVQDYTHSTAPNRRFPDMVTQRLLKAVTTGRPNPYSDSELQAIASNCTLKENAANKVEREMAKRMAAIALSRRIGEIFDGIVTGVTEHGTFVRILKPHVEGLLIQGQEGADVGDRFRVKLVRTDVQRGYIDFVRA
jgi:VacB/RNase II family 3'-5' exoribonuclease